jgi:hypothetical protein
VTALRRPKTGEVHKHALSGLMSSFEKVKSGIEPRFLSQKIDVNEPEKKMPSTAAKATGHLANVKYICQVTIRYDLFLCEDVC